MLRFSSIQMLALLGLMFGFVAQTRAADEPKDAAIAFAKAVQAGDKKAIRDSAVGTDEQFKTVEVLSDFIPAIKKFKDACDKKFGADNLLSKSMAGGVPDLSDEAAKAEYKVDGDSATAINKDKPNEKNPMKLKKVAGAWKVDLGSMGDEGKEIAAKAPAMTKVFSEMADDILAGKFKTAEEAAVAMGPKLQEASK